MILRIIVLISLVMAIGCGGDGSKKANDETTQEAPTYNVDPSSIEPADEVTTIAPPKEPAQNASGVWHYTCPKGCEGGSGSAVPCSVCGTTLVHNQGYHGDANSATPPTGQNPTQAQPKPAEPAQNAAGVWHFTCPQGCAGGSGSASPCPSCGTTLAHNQAYHN